MKKIKLLVTAALLTGSCTLAALADCPNTQAWGGGWTTYGGQPGDSEKIDVYTCNSCYGCLDGCGYPANCGTVCVASVVVDPSEINSHWDPSTNTWVPFWEHESCQDYTTASCSP